MLRLQVIKLLGSLDFQGDRKETKIVAAEDIKSMFKGCAA
jgi:hypothetical protein